MLGSGPAAGRKCQHVGGWAQEERRRVIFTGKGVEGRHSGASRLGWEASRMYALSVYRTSRMFFSLHQVRA